MYMYILIYVYINDKNNCGNVFQICFFHLSIHLSIYL